MHYLVQSTKKKFIQKIFKYEIKNNQKEILIKELLKKDDNFIINFIENLNNEQKAILFTDKKIFNFLFKIDGEKEMDYLPLDFIKYVYEKEIESCYHNISYLFWNTNNEFVEKIKERLYKKYKENTILKEKSVIELSEIKTLDGMELSYYLSNKKISELIENRKLFDYYLGDDDEIVFDVFQDMDLNQKLNSFHEEKFIAYSKKIIDTQKNEDKEYFYSNHFKEVVSEIADKNLSNYYQQVLFLFDNLNTDEINIIKYRMYSIKEKIKENKTNIISI